MRSKKFGILKMVKPDKIGKCPARPIDDRNFPVFFVVNLTKSRAYGRINNCLAGAVFLHHGVGYNCILRLGINAEGYHDHQTCQDQPGGKRSGFIESMNCGYKVQCVTGLLFKPVKYTDNSFEFIIRAKRDDDFPGTF